MTATHKAAGALPKVEVLAERCTARAWQLEQSHGTFRVTDAATGTLVAGDWTHPDGYGLSLAAVARVVPD